jgi:glucose-1-phosphate adenylyltransferase
MAREVLAVILGGGAGTRLFPLTLRRSKPAVPFGGKYRIIDITVSNCINSGVHRIFVLTQFNSASLNRHIARTYRFSGLSEGFVEILAAEQTLESRDWFQGPADAVRQVMIHIESASSDDLLVLSGDHLYRMDYRPFIRRHQETGADVTLSTLPVDESRASSFGLLKVNESGRIVEFREKPPANELPAMRVDTTRFGPGAEDAARRPYLASMGVYVFKLDALRELLRNTKFVDFGGEVIPAAIATYNTRAFLFDGYWEDIGAISALYHANLELTRVRPKFNLFDEEAPIYTRARMLPPSKMTDCRVKNSIIAEGSILDNSVIEHSVIGIRSRVGANARIEDTLMMGADYYQSLDELSDERRRGIPWIGVGEGVVIRRAIIDKNARIGAGARILNEPERVNYDGDNYYIRDGIVIVPKNATIPDSAVI